MVEGGSSLLQGFIDRQLWDEIRIERSGKALHRGVPSPTPPQGIYDIRKVNGNNIIGIKRDKSDKSAV